MKNQPLFFSKRFLPIFSVQFLGALNDNLFRSAAAMLIVFSLVKTSEQGTLTALAAGIFILPFFLFSAFAGNLADQIEKTKLVKRIKFIEIIVMSFGAWAIFSSSLIALFILLFLMGSQSAFFGPIKYSILPEYVQKNELTTGNGWFSASTFIAILLGTLIGGWVVLTDSGTLWLGALVISMAVLGWVMSLFMPPSHPRPSPKKVPPRLLYLTKKEVLAGIKYPQAFLAVLAIAWFWFLGAGYLSQIPVMVKNYMFGNEQVVLLFLTTFSLGIGLGAFLVSKLAAKFKQVSKLQYHGAMILSLSAFMVLSNIFMLGIDSSENLRGISEFLADLPSTLVLICLLMIATVGGAYIVPLYTHLQIHSPDHFRGRMVAVNNIVNSFLMVLSSILFMLGYALGLNLLDMLYILALMNVVVAIALYKKIANLRRTLT